LIHAPLEGIAAFRLRYNLPTQKLIHGAARALALDPEPLRVLKLAILYINSPWPQHDFLALIVAHELIVE
jgi:hypothetical protein